MIELVLLLTFLGIKFGRDFSGLSYSWLDNTISRYEARWGKLLWVAFISLVLIAAACLYARLDINCAYLGRHYAQLARDPFAADTTNPVAFRLLTPLISYIIGLHGKGIIITNLIISMFMIGLVYVHFRKSSARPGDAFLAVVVTAFSLIVLTSIHCGGYCDILTYVIVFLMWRYRANRVLFYALFLVGLLNRESIAFLLPWFLYISWEPRRKWYSLAAEIILGFGVAIALYCLFRHWISLSGDVKYSLNYYVDPLLKDPLQAFRGTFYYHSIGFFSVFKTLWIFPAVAVVSWWKKGSYNQLISVTLLVICAYAQVFLAYDTSRMLTLSFMVMFVSLEHLLDTDFAGFRRWAFWAVLFNLFIPQVYTAGKIVEAWQTLSSHLISKII